MTCPCPECSALGRETHIAPPPIDLPDDHTAWFEEYEPESLPLAREWVGCIASLFLAIPLVMAVIWRGVTAWGCK